jgi:hypothetical protein
VRRRWVRSGTKKEKKQRAPGQFSVRFCLFFSLSVVQRSEFVNHCSWVISGCLWFCLWKKTKKKRKTIQKEKI